MRIDKAIRVLRRFQDWRTGIDCRPLADTGWAAGELTAAIDAVLKRHGMPEPLTDCRECVYNDEGFGTCVRIVAFKNRKCKFVKREEDF